MRKVKYEKYHNPPVPTSIVSCHVEIVKKFVCGQLHSKIIYKYFNNFIKMHITIVKNKNYKILLTKTKNCD